MSVIRYKLWTIGNILTFNSCPAVSVWHIIQTWSMVLRSWEILMGREFPRTWAFFFRQWQGIDHKQNTAKGLEVAALRTEWYGKCLDNTWPSTYSQLWLNQPFRWKTKCTVCVPQWAMYRSVVQCHYEIVWAHDKGVNWFVFVGAFCVLPPHRFSISEYFTRYSKQP